jgi:hypothetical protein
MQIRTRHAKHDPPLQATPASQASLYKISRSQFCTQASTPTPVEHGNLNARLDTPFRTSLWPYSAPTPAVELVEVLNGIFDPPPQRPAVPWTFICAVLLVVFATAAVATAGSARWAARVDGSRLRDL